MSSLFGDLPGRLRDLRFSLFYTLLPRSSCRVVTLGDTCQWTIEDGSISSNSVVYSAGVGQDISFEKELATRFGCSIFLFDPSPTGATTMADSRNQHPQLTFEQIGLSDSDGEISFDVPASGAEGSYRKPQLPGAGSEKFQCLTLPTIMRRHGHNRIDLLKMDIEGFEYGVLQQICAQGLPVRQICVEFHHSLVPGITRGQTIAALVRLKRAGYALIDRKNWDHTFLRTSI